jgi:hypothetical protein
MAAFGGNEILFCGGCGGAEHQKCAGVAAVPEGDWFCTACAKEPARKKAKAVDERWRLPHLPLKKAVRPSFFTILPKQPVVVEEQPLLLRGARLHLKATAAGAGESTAPGAPLTFWRAFEVKANNNLALKAGLAIRYVRSRSATADQGTSSCGTRSRD